MTVHDEWRWTDERGVQRQVGTEELRAALANSVLPPSTLVWRKGMVEWAPASTLPELASAAHAVTAPTTLPKEVRAQRPADVGRPQRPRASVPPPRGPLSTLVGIAGHDEAATKDAVAAPIVVPTVGAAPGGGGAGAPGGSGEGGGEGSRVPITQIPKYGSPDVDIAAASQEIPKAPRLPDPLIARPRPRRLSTNDVDGFWAAPSADRIVVEERAGEALDLGVDIEGLVVPAVPAVPAAVAVQPLKAFGAPSSGATKLSSQPLPSTLPEGTRGPPGATKGEASSASAPLEPVGVPIALAVDPATVVAREQVTVREPAVVPRDKVASSPDPSTLPARAQVARDEVTVREPAMVPRDPGAAAGASAIGAEKASAAASTESAPASRRDREVTSSRSGAPRSNQPLSQRPPPPPPQPVRPGRQPATASPQRARPVTEGEVKEVIAHLPPPPPLPRDTAAFEQKSDPTVPGIGPPPAPLATSTQPLRSPARQTSSWTQTPTKLSRTNDEEPTLLVPGAREVQQNAGEVGNQAAAKQAPGAAPQPARPPEAPGGIEKAAENTRSQFASRPPPRPPRLSRPPPLSFDPPAPEPAAATASPKTASPKTASPKTTSPKTTSAAEGSTSASMSAMARDPLSSRTDVSPRPDLVSQRAAPPRAAPAVAVTSPGVVAGAVTGSMARVEPVAVAPEDTSLLTVSRGSLFGASGIVTAMIVGAFLVGRASVKALPLVAQPSLYAVPALARAVVPEPLKPCWVARQAVMWAPMASRSIPFDVVATAQGSLAVGYARLDEEAAGLEVTPSTGEVHPRFAKSVPGTIKRVVPMPNAEFRVTTESAGGLSPAVPVPAATPFFIGVRDGALATADTLDGAASRLWPVSNGEGVATARVQLAGDQGYAVTLRLEKAIWSGWLGPDRAPRGDLTKVVGSGGAAGRPNSGWNRRELAVVFADKPEGAEHWEIRVGRAPTGSVPTSTTVVPLPKGGPGGDAFAPDIAGLPDGRWVLVWTEGPPGSRAIRAQTLAPDLKPIGDPIALSPPAGNFGQGVLGVVDSYAGVIFLSKGAASYELWGAILQCG